MSLRTSYSKWRHYGSMLFLENTVTLPITSTSLEKIGNHCTDGTNESRGSQNNVHSDDCESNSLIHSMFI